MFAVCAPNTTRLRSVRPRNDAGDDRFGYAVMDQVPGSGVLKVME